MTEDRPTTEWAQVLVQWAMAREARIVSALYRAVLPHPSREAFLDHAMDVSQLLIATIDAAPVRFGILNRSCFDHVLIALLVVHPDSQGRAVATTVVRRVEAICPSEKHFTSTNASNTTMRHLCEIEVPELFTFFVSDLAGFVTGGEHKIDGAMYAQLGVHPSRQKCRADLGWWREADVA